AVRWTDRIAEELPRAVSVPNDTGRYGQRYGYKRLVAARTLNPRIIALVRAGCYITALRRRGNSIHAGDYIAAPTNALASSVSKAASSCSDSSPEEDPFQSKLASAKSAEPLPSDSRSSQANRARSLCNRDVVVAPNIDLSR